MANSYELMKRSFLQQVKAVSLELISVSEEKRDKRDPQSGAIVGAEEFVKVTAEVPRGNGLLSRLRFDVKIPGGRLKITEEQIDVGVFEVVFKNLEISYIDSGRNQLYFRANDYDVKEVG